MKVSSGVTGNVPSGAQHEDAHGSPLFADVGVLAFVPDMWHEPWQGRHRVLSRLAQYFHIVWANPALEWRPQWLSSSLSNLETAHYVSPIDSRFTVYNPGKWMPQTYRPRFLARCLQRERLRQMRRILATRGVNRIILYLWRPQFDFALDGVEHDVSCYHIDDEYTFSSVEQPTDERERRLISAVDQVFIHSTALFEKKGNLNRNSLLVPNGVDYRSYVTPQPEPVEMSRIPHPRMGYVGVIKSQLDLALLKALARRHPAWSFVLVGPLGVLGENAQVADELAAMPNTFFLGQKSVAELPAYTQHLDVCMLCYKVDDYTKFIYPLKLHEYLASGRPIVGSPIPALQEFGYVLKLAGTLEEWSRALGDCLEPAESSSSRVAERRDIARRYDWDDLVQVIAKTLTDRLGLQYTERFQQALTMCGKSLGR